MSEYLTCFYCGLKSPTAPCERCKPLYHEALFEIVTKDYNRSKKNHLPAYRDCYLHVLTENLSLHLSKEEIEEEVSNYFFEKYKKQVERDQQGDITVIIHKKLKTLKGEPNYGSM